MALRGALVVFEGAEGVGKTTQVRHLVHRLQAREIPHLALREPGGTALGDALRELLLHHAHDVVPAAEALMFMASRAQLVETTIRPALQEGKVVVLDRFFLSTYAYQIGGRLLSDNGVRESNQLAVNGLVPDVTFFLDLPESVGFARVNARGSLDRMEAAGTDFHHRVREAFTSFLDPQWQQQHPECGPVIGIDASGSQHAVFDRIVSQLVSVRPDVFSPLLTDVRRDVTT